MPPPWASSRIKLNQQFYRHKLVPPADIVETASFLATLSFVREGPAVGFVAEAVARAFEREGLRTLDLPLPIELPPVGILTLRSRHRTPAAAQLIECLRWAAGEAAPGRRDKARAASRRNASASK